MSRFAAAPLSRCSLACEMNDCSSSALNRSSFTRATETAARFVRRLENGLAESAPPWSADRYSRPLGRRANQRRVVSFLQRLAGALRTDSSTFLLTKRSERFTLPLIDPLGRQAQWH